MKTGTPLAEASSRVQIGSLLWVLAFVMNFGLQLIVVQAWPVPYLIADHTVSDLGYTTCVEEARPGGVLETCSPLHALFNIGGVAQYLIVGVGAVLLARRYRWSRATIAAALVMTAGGIGVSVVPGDVSITAHTLLAVPLFLGVLALLLFAARQSRSISPLVSVSAAAVAGATIAGMVWLGFSLAGHGPVGWSERLAAESIYVWFVIAGTAALRSPREGDDSDPQASRA